MPILRVLQIGFIARAVVTPGFHRPDENGLSAEERAPETLFVPGSGPELLFMPGAFDCPVDGLPEGACKAIIDPYHNVDVTPFNRARAVIVAVKHPVWRSL